MSDTDLVALYAGPLLELAANIPHAGRLDTADGSAKHRSPLCGSSVTVDLSLTGDQITAFAQEVRACALGQASAAAFGAGVMGSSAAQIRQLRNDVAQMLADDGPAPCAPFEKYALLAAARDYKNRHASIMLVLDAACEALDQAENKA